MILYSLQDAQIHLKDLINAALKGKLVWIKNERGAVVQLHAVLIEKPDFRRKAGSAKGLIDMEDKGDKPQLLPRKAGSAQGLVVMSEDFDDPLNDLDEYMK